MHKVKLEIEKLAVESFEAAETPEPQAGTVHANAAEQIASKPLSDCFWSLCQTCGIYC
ncbi:MAG TPA: hypothetical protein VF092_03480 [Longimicrobium sp.]